MALTEHEIPRPGARPRRIGLTDDGRVWYVDHAEGVLGAFDPASATFEEWAAPAGAGARPYGMAVDGQDRIWFVETGVQPNRMIGFDPAAGEYFAAGDVPSGGGSVRHMQYHAPTNAIWFGADTDTIGRLELD
jgi:virginiamycin B lyase